jgi:hypothetical protein
MTFPSSPQNEQLFRENGIVYRYNASLNAWFRYQSTTANVITTDTANIVSNISSTSTTTGALKVAGGIGVQGNVVAGAVYTDSYFYANGTAFTGGSGSVGYTGSAGTIGYTGSVSTVAGYTGSKGDIGYTGSFGNVGYTGSLGYTGSAGIDGYTGSVGLGYTGSVGVGYTGSVGVGYTGSEGAQGAIGYTGSAGGGGGGGNGYTGSAGLPSSLASGVVTDTFTGNGVQTAFTLSVSPLSEDQTIVNIDGIVQQRSSYTVVGFTLTLDEAPLSGEVVEVTTLAYGTTQFINRNFTANGSVSTFTVTNGVTADSIFVTVNGVIQRPTIDYTVSGVTLTMLDTPAANDVVTVREIPAATVNRAVYSRTSITATAGQTNFAVAYTIGYLQVYLNGVLLNDVDYTATTGATVVLTDAAAVGDLVEFVTFNTVPVQQTSTAIFNSTNLTSNLAITAGYSAVSVGPISVANGVTISIASGQKWVIL